MIFASDVNGFFSLPERIRSTEAILAEELSGMVVTRNDPDDLQLELIFGVRVQDVEDEVCLLLRGVSDLRVSLQWPSLMSFVQLEVGDISDRQMEDVKWHVRCLDEDVVSCYAKEAHVSLRSRSEDRSGSTDD